MASTANVLTSSSKAHPFRGYLYIAAATFCWGLSATLGKAVFTGRLLGGEGIGRLDPVILSQARTTLSVLVLAPALLAWRGRAALTMTKHDALRCMLLGATGIVGSNFFYYYAIERTTVATAIILQYTAPAWVLLYMLARRLDRPTTARIGGVAMAVAGSALAIGLFGRSEFRADLLGVAAALGAAFCFALYNVGGRFLLERQDRWKVVTYTLVGCSLFWLVVNPPWKIAAAGYSGAQWAFLAVFALVSMLVPYSFYFSGLHHLDATRAVVTSCLEPVFAILLAMAFLGESFGWLQAVGMLIVLAATILVQKPERAARVPAEHAP